VHPCQRGTPGRLETLWRLRGPGRVPQRERGRCVWKAGCRPPRRLNRGRQ
jgi:hypothetical protein